MPEKRFDIELLVFTRHSCASRYCCGAY